MPTIHLRIQGDVQGVFYRASAKKIAEEIGVKGWIKNTANGNVEALVSASEDQLKQFKAWCSKGPAKALVTRLEETEQEEISFAEFCIIR
ncbi:MAG: acylphosphatase [Ferruginibacter sp.]